MGQVTGQTLSKLPESRRGSNSAKHDKARGCTTDGSLGVLQPRVSSEVSSGIADKRPALNFQQPTRWGLSVIASARLDTVLEQSCRAVGLDPHSARVFLEVSVDAPLVLRNSGAHPFGGSLLH
jgi:hypothetical protein